MVRAPRRTLASCLDDQPRLKLRVKATSLKPTVSATTLSATNLLPPKTKKAELAQLRGQVFNLEEQLRLLQKNPGFDVVTDGSWRHGRIYQQVVEQKPKKALSVWEELSMRQYQQRRASEVENMRLKATLEDYLTGVRIRLLPRDINPRIKCPRREKIVLAEHVSFVPNTTKDTVKTLAVWKVQLACTTL